MSLPWSSQIASLHMSLMVPSAWLTRSIVRACPISSSIFRAAFFLNLASPADRASSMMRTSGSMCTATEKARRENMPEEYVRMGMSMKSPSSAKSAISW